LANVPAFKSWLKYLVKEMHTQLPNSILIFYDSVTNAGELKWQSQLNEKNLEYFEICDYFFTDYHWNLEKLQEGWAFAESLQRTNDVFVGTDIWGRGTFGGGKFESYKGVTEARKLGFSVALFAQGFTY
jgi:mannosyl-glycoprotein endo-beta-N-acetylglucosaminidase